MVPEVVGLFSPALCQVLSIGKKTRRGDADVGVERLYTLVRALDEHLGVKKALDTEDDSVRAAQADGDAAVSNA